MGSISSLLVQSRHFSNTHSHLWSLGGNVTDYLSKAELLNIQILTSVILQQRDAGCKAMCFRMASQSWNLEQQSARVTTGTLKDLGSVYAMTVIQTCDFLEGGVMTSEWCKCCTTKSTLRTERSVWFGEDNPQTLLTWEMSMHITGSLCPYSERKN